MLGNSRLKDGEEMTRCPRIEPVEEAREGCGGWMKVFAHLLDGNFALAILHLIEFCIAFGSKIIWIEKNYRQNFKLYSHGPSLSKEIVLLLTSQYGVLRELLDFFFGNNTCACSHLKYLLVTDDKYDTVRMTIRQLKFNEEQGSKMQSIFTALLNTAVAPNLQKRRRPEWVEIRVI